MKKLNNGFIKKVNFLENHVKIFNGKFNINRQDFYVNDVRNADSIYLYGILDANKQDCIMIYPVLSSKNLI